MRFLGFIKINCNLRVLTGLHIGGSREGVELGATDNPVIKGPDGKPYIPGSSLKGKIRSLLELAEGLPIDDKLGRHECKENEKVCNLCIVFGRSSDRKKDEGPTRAIFRDCFINEDLSDRNAKKLDYTEVKYENSINRITSRVEYGLRDTERVLPGTVFDVEITYRVYDVDVNGAKLENIKDLNSLPSPLKDRFGLILKGMKLLEEDYLGGCGSRGYGKVKFENLKIDVLPLERFIRGDGSITIFSGDLSKVSIQ